MFRRSERLRSVKSVTDYEDLDTSKPVLAKNKRGRPRKKPVKAEPQTEEEGSNQDLSDQLCCKCLKTCTLVEGESEFISWLQCCDCGKWWHALCARLTVEDTEKFDKYNINFVCAFCVLGIESCRDIGESSVKSSVVELDTVHCKLDKLIAVNLTQIEGAEVSESLSRSDSSYSEERVVVVDNISVPGNFRHSDIIAKEIKQYSCISGQCDLAYSLAQGGVALHLKEGVDPKEVIHNWPDSIFGGKTVVHQTQRYRGIRKVSAFLRDIPPSISIETIKKALSDIPYKSIRRLRFYDTKKPMPIIKVEFQNVNDCESALRSNGIIITGVDKKVYFCPERSFKAVRCFNCHRYGHISDCCVHPKRCVNCGEEDCGETKCQKPSVCVNCGKGHKSSSSACTTFREILKKRKLYSIIHQ